MTRFPRRRCLTAIAEIGSDDEERFLDVDGDAIAANPDCFLDNYVVAPYDAETFNAFSERASSDDE